MYGISVMCCRPSSLSSWLFVFRFFRWHTASSFRCSAVCTQLFMCLSEFLCTVDGEGLQTRPWWNLLLYHSSCSNRLIHSIQAVFVNIAFAYLRTIAISARTCSCVATLLWRFEQSEVSNVMVWVQPAFCVVMNEGSFSSITRIKSCLRSRFRRDMTINFRRSICSATSVCEAFTILNRLQMQALWMGMLGMRECKVAKYTKVYV